MKCEEVDSLIIDYLDNCLPDSHRAIIEKHLATCERCLDEIRSFKVILNEVDSAPLEQPDESLRINFHHMLQSEINKQVQTKSPKPLLHFLSSRYLNVAAGIAILAGGIFIGLFFNADLQKKSSRAELSKLTTEVQNMKELVMLSMLKEESPSQRIQAVNYADDIQSPDEEILQALTKTLNHDKNTNVRLAAAYSLAKYADRQSVRDSLVRSLEIQNEPIIQVVLINILVDKKESRAVKPIQKIISDEKTLDDVKQIAQKGIKILL